MKGGKNIMKKLNNNSTIKSMKLLLTMFFIVATLISLPYVSASAQELSSLVTQKQFEPVTITQGGDNGTDYFSECTISSIMSPGPNSTILISNVSMAPQGNEFIYTMDGSLNSKTGWYTVYGECDGHTWPLTFETTTTGFSWTSSALPILIFLFFLAFAFIISGYLMDNAWLAVMSGFCFTVSGLFVLTFGIASLSNFYTQAMGVIVLGMGVIMMIGASYSIIDDSSEHHGLFYFGEKKEKDEADYFETNEED